MGFKVDTKFLRNITMGAVGVGATIPILRNHGLEPIELERYCLSNKIWATKIKRLRVPDLLCIRTGTRIEVRAKSKLRIAMSDAPGNPDRRWDVGLRDEDLVVFIAVNEEGGSLVPSSRANVFSVEAMRSSVASSKLSGRKSATEGSEQSREWPTSVPGKDGTVEELKTGSIVVRFASGRKQIYKLSGDYPKYPYLTPGDSFTAGDVFLSGTVPGLADLGELETTRWEPSLDLSSDDATTRYSAVKAISFVDSKFPRGVLLRIMDEDIDERIRLEAAGSLARIGVEDGFAHLRRVAHEHETSYLRMEAVLIATELGDGAVADLLGEVADGAGEFPELRQAAVWGLGWSGARAYDRLVRYVGHPEDEVAMHAIAAFGDDVARPTIEKLADILASGSQRERVGALETLARVGTKDVLAAMVDRIHESGDDEQSAWLLAVVGRLDATMVRSELRGTPLLRRVAPMLLGSSGNWLASPAASRSFRFLLEQSM